MPGPYHEHQVIRRAAGDVHPRSRGSLSQSEGEGIGRLIDGARAVLRRALALMAAPDTLPDGVDRLWQILFLARINGGDFARVHARLETLSGCLHNTVTIKVMDLGRRCGYVRSYLDPRTKKQMPGKQRTEGTKLGHQVFRGDIHIDRCLLEDANFDMGIVTLIHEASHKYASTEDHGEPGYFNEETYGGYRAAGLTAAEARNNADSYAFFVFLLAEMSAGRIRVG